MAIDPPRWRGQRAATLDIAADDSRTEQELSGLDALELAGGIGASRASRIWAGT